MVALPRLAGVAMALLLAIPGPANSIELTGIEGVEVKYHRCRL